MNETDIPAVIKFVKEKYHEVIIVVKQLSSFEDTNILIQSTKQNLDTNKFVLKILSCSNEASESYIRKIECVKHLSKQHFWCSNFLSGIDGKYVQTFPENGPYQDRHALLYTFLEGKELEYTQYAKFPVIITELGSYLAHFHSILRTLPQESREDQVPDSDDPWCPHNYKLLLEENCLDIVEDTSKKEVLSAAMDYVLKRFTSSEDLLTKDILHGDFHGLNVIVKETYSPEKRSECSLFTNIVKQSKTIQESNISCSQESDSNSIDVQIASLSDLLDKVNKKLTARQDFRNDLFNTYGLIDFEEMLYSYTVLEVGRLITDVMVVFIVQCAETDGDVSDSEKKDAKSDMSGKTITDINSELTQNSKNYLMKIGGYVLGGYLVVNNLLSIDMKCIYPAVLISLCQYYILGTRAALNPSLSESYVSYCSREAFLLLEFFHHLNPDIIASRWVDVAESMLQICFDE